MIGVPFGAETATSWPIALSGLGIATADWAARRIAPSEIAEKATIVSWITQKFWIQTKEQKQNRFRKTVEVWLLESVKKVSPPEAMKSGSVSACLSKSK